MPSTALETSSGIFRNDLETSTLMDSTSFLSNIRLRSCSRKNFAANLVRAVFSEQDRAASNVNGKNNKKKLDPTRIQAIKEASFKMFPCSTGETELSAWPACIIAIDQSCRRLNRKAAPSEQLP